MATADVLPACPGCHGASFTRASLFGPTQFSRQDTATGTSDRESDALIDAVVDQIEEPGRYVVFQDTGTVRTVTIPRDCMRIGRSLSADLRFEDPTVSRRHAVLISESAGVRVLDDRSLNGVFVNGERIVTHLLSDGDEIVIGRYVLRYADRTSATAASAAGAPALAE